MELTEKEYIYVRNLSLEEIEKLRSEIKMGNLDSLRIWLAHSCFVGIRKAIRRNPNIETLNGILQFIDEVKLNGSR